MTETKAGITTIVIFGASGELTKRKIVPALYNLFLEDLLPSPSWWWEPRGAHSRRRVSRSR